MTDHLNSNLSRNSELLAEDVRLLCQPDLSIGSDIKKPDLKEWFDYVKESLGGNAGIITDQMIEQVAARDLDNITSLRLYFPSNQTCCAALLPFDFRGEPLERWDIEREMLHIQKLAADSSSKNPNPLAIIQKRLFAFQPAEISQYCFFQTPQYTEKPDPPYDISLKERSNLYAKYFRALQNLQNLWNTYLKSKSN